MDAIRLMVSPTAMALVLSLAAWSCDLPCKDNSDCFGTTPVCDVLKCDCASHDGCSCTAACKSDGDCADGFFCNDLRFCELRAGGSDPDCH